MQKLQVKAVSATPEKRPYIRPELIKHGSVEQLTLFPNISQLPD